jgi:hypothetical protein
VELFEEIRRGYAAGETILDWRRNMECTGEWCASSMLSRNGSHMSTHAASIRLRCRGLNSSRRNSSKVSFFRVLPNHSGTPD